MPYEALISTLPLTVRMHRSPFWESSHASGAKGYIVYNHTLIATGFTEPEDEYRHLKEAVQIWDVGAERQVEIQGPDAAKLVQMSTPREIAKMRDDLCFYIPTVDGEGKMTNDPVLLRVEEDRYWVSIADSDLVLYYKGIAAALKLNVRISEPAVAPLALQGPRADDLAAAMWGDEVRDIRFFRHKRVDVNGTPMILARSGYSTQGGFELYFEGRKGANKLWNQLFEAGKAMDVRAGTPNQAERIEAGMLSYLSDITADMTPFESNLGHFCELTRDVGCLGYAALKQAHVPTRQVRPLEIEGDPLPVMGAFWPVRAGEQYVGRVSSCAWTYDYDCNAAIALINQSHFAPTTELTVETPQGPRNALVKSKFWSR